MIRCPQCGHEWDAEAGTPLRQVLAEALAAPGPNETDWRLPQPFRLRYRRPAGMTREAEAAVLCLANVWHTRVARITVLNQARFAALCCRLADGYEAAAIQAAMEAYGRDEWHAKHPSARLDLEGFCRVSKLETWIRAAELSRETRERSRPPAPAVQRLVRGVAGAMLQDPEQARRRAWDALPVAQRRRLFDLAVAAFAPARPMGEVVTLKAMELMEQEQAHGTERTDQPVNQSAS